MGKADMSRDYYADLELSSTADISDIKKQFRKLALKYHPDRNPGREAEVNSKFQLIQSAHEILADPEQKAKYDASRSRARYPTASGVKGNPWANAATNFPPPPRRNASTRNPPPSGANKYRNFTSGVPPTAKAPQRDDGAEARRNAWRAFESMRPSSHGKAGQSNSSEKPEPTQTTTGTRPVPRTPSQKQRAEAAFGTRKSGFVPRSPVPGDEPPVTTRNYATGRHTASLFNDTASGARRGSIDPLGQAPLDSRQSTPYSTHGGEKTNPFDGVPLGRARSTREGSRPGTAASSANLSPGTSRQRSSSAPRSAKDDGANPRPTVFDSERPNTANPASHPPLDPFKSRASAKYTPDSAMPAASAGLTDQGASTAAAAAYGNSGANSTASTKSNGPSIFNFAFSADEGIFTRTSPKLNTFTRNSADDINTRFVHDEAPTWQFNAGSPQEDSPAKPRSQSGSRAGRKSPVKRPSLRHTKNIPSKQAEPVLSTSEDGFDAQGWSQKIDAQHFVPQPNPSGAGSPGRPARSNSRKPKSVRPTMGSAGMVNEDTSSSSEEGDSRGRQPYAEAASTNSPNAMDIDPPSPLPTASGPGSGANGARKIPVEPSRPDWRAGNVKGVKGGAPISSMQGPPRFSANAQGSEDSEEFLASFGDLKNVAPFAKTVDGLGSFGDMKSNLPFESQPSAKIPIEKVVKPTFRFPPVPQAPRAPPPLAISGLKPSGGTWQRYVLDFQGYVQRWDIFNAQIVEYLELRKAAIAKSRQDKGYSFLAARGDDDIQDYMTSLQQDNEVRRKWTEACADHEQRIREFMAFRERMR